MLCSMWAFVSIDIFIYLFIFLHAYIYILCGVILKHWVSDPGAEQAHSCYFTAPLCQCVSNVVFYPSTRASQCMKSATRLFLQEGVKTENDHINLKVAGQDGSVVQFKIKRHTPLSKLMKAYCERQVTPESHHHVLKTTHNLWKCCIFLLWHPCCVHWSSWHKSHALLSFLQGLAIRQIRFRFDGQPINETDTPAQVLHVLHVNLRVLLCEVSVSNVMTQQAGD